MTEEQKAALNQAAHKSSTYIKDLVNLIDDPNLLCGAMAATVALFASTQDIETGELLTAIVESLNKLVDIEDEITMSEVYAHPGNDTIQ